MSEEQLVLGDFWQAEVAPLDQQEDEADIVGAIDYSNVVSMSTDWTIETINNQVRKKNIDLDPSFQRRAAWDDIRKSRLIESVIVGMPIPNIVLADSKLKKGQFIVIDGKQRLLAINEFLDGKYRLQGLDIREDLNGCYFSTLPEDDRQNLENSTIRSTVIKNWVDENFLYAMFFRLNSGSLPLSPQELRKAVVGGRLLDTIDEYIEKSHSFKSIFGDTPDRRMRDSELVLRFIAFDQGLQQYGGNLKPFLDRIVKDYESAWDLKQPELQQSLNRLDTALNCSSKIFGLDSFKKALPEGGYERRMNRAIFDALARSFSDEEVAKKAAEKKDTVVNLLKDACNNSEFKAAIEKSTKTLGATRLRIDYWSRSLAAAIGLNYDTESMRIQ